MVKKKSQAGNNSAEANEPEQFSTLTPRQRAFKVASLAWSKGWTVARIVKELKLESRPENFTLVKRALAKAHRDGILKLQPAPEDDLRDQLTKAFPGIEFHVVENEFGQTAHGVGQFSEPVYVKAAEVIAKRITNLVEVEMAGGKTNGRAKDMPQPEKRVVVCNAGGHTIAQTVVALQRNPPAFDVEMDEVNQRLLFVAANSAYLPKRFNQAANYLAVFMSALFGDSEHMSVPPVPEQEFLKEHRDAVENADLFICGAGTRKYGMMIAHFYDEHSWQVPEDAVGDLAFNFLDKDGNEVQLLDNEAAKNFMDQLNPSLKYKTLRRLAREKRVLLILDPDDKIEIGIAAFLGGVVNEAVLGSKLAVNILKEWKERKKNRMQRVTGNVESSHAMNMQEYLKNRQQFPLDELAKYSGKWVAWSPDGTRIVAFSAHPEELDALIQKEGEDPEQCVVEGIPAVDSILGA